MLELLSALKLQPVSTPESDTERYMEVIMPRLHKVHVIISYKCIFVIKRLRADSNTDKGDMLLFLLELSSIWRSAEFQLKNSLFQNDEGRWDELGLHKSEVYRQENSPISAWVAKFLAKKISFCFDN